MEDPPNCQVLKSVHVELFDNTRDLVDEVGGSAIDEHLMDKWMNIGKSIGK